MAEWEAREEGEAGPGSEEGEAGPGSEEKRARQARGVKRRGRGRPRPYGGLVVGFFQ